MTDATLNKSAALIVAHMLTKDRHLKTQKPTQ